MTHIIGLGGGIWLGARLTAHKGLLERLFAVAVMIVGLSVARRALQVMQMS